MSTGIEVRVGKEISKRVVVSLYNKRLINEIFFKVVCNGPLKGEELGLTQVIVPLSLSQRLAPISNGMQLPILPFLEQNCSQPIGGCISLQHEGF